MNSIRTVLEYKWTGDKKTWKKQYSTILRHMMDYFNQIYITYKNIEE